MEAPGQLRGTPPGAVSSAPQGQVTQPLQMVSHCEMGLKNPTLQGFVDEMRACMSYAAWQIGGSVRTYTGVLCVAPGRTVAGRRAFMDLMVIP